MKSFRMSYGRVCFARKLFSGLGTEPANTRQTATQARLKCDRHIGNHKSFPMVPDPYDAVRTSSQPPSAGKKVRIPDVSTRRFRPDCHRQAAVADVALGALATLREGTTNPFCSLVNIGTMPDGSPILLISRWRSIPVILAPIGGPPCCSASRPRPIRWPRRESASQAMPSRLPNRTPWQPPAGAISLPIHRQNSLWILRIFRSIGSRSKPALGWRIRPDFRSVGAVMC